MPNQYRISIIDDDESVRKALCRLIRSAGLVSQVFVSAEAFLQAGALINSDCIVSDIQMPSLSGMEFQKILLAQGSCVPLIFMTAFPEKAIRDQVLSAGAVSFLSKPFEANEMIRCIELALLRKHCEHKD